MSKGNPGYQILNKIKTFPLPMRNNSILRRRNLFVLERLGTFYDGITLSLHAMLFHPPQINIQRLFLILPPCTRTILESRQTLSLYNAMPGVESAKRD
tara:strand:- start:277 stop:570 length:294 start_codon:yes stop_codon:yes gene_type:complete